MHSLANWNAFQLRMYDAKVWKMDKSRSVWTV
jgi:hypothetical protein